MKASQSEKLIFTKNLATLIKAGVPMDQTIETILEQSSGDLRKIVTTINKEVVGGKGLSEALRKYPKVFDDFFVGMVEAGEKSGNLEVNLNFLAEQMTKDFALRKKIQGALMYPALVMVLTLVMGTGIAWYILPKLIDLFLSFEVELPLSTKILMWVAFFMRDYGLWVMIFLMGVIVISGVLMRYRPIKKWWHTVLLRLSLFGKVARAGELAKFNRNLGVLLKSGIAVDESLSITAKTLGNLKFRDDLEEILKEVIKGKKMATILSQRNYWEFDSLTTKMIGVGEKSGNLDEMMSYLSEFYDNEIDNTTKNMSTLLEPVLLIVISLVVGFVAMAIVNPIYSLMGGIGQ